MEIRIKKDGGVLRGMVSKEIEEKKNVGKSQAVEAILDLACILEALK